MVENEYVIILFLVVFIVKFFIGLLGFKFRFMMFEDIECVKKEYV